MSEAKMMAQKTKIGKTNYPANADLGILHPYYIWP